MTEDQIRERIDKMTLDEKIGMVHGEASFRSKGVERLGIPPFVYSDGPMGVRPDYEDAGWDAIGNTDDYCSYLPSNTALAATFDRELAYEAGQILGAETRGRGKDMILGPGVNIQRSPLGGRNFEYFSEDPYLAGEMAAAYVRGVQENDVSACVKHFAANNQETGRCGVDVRVSERALREIYLPAFHKAVEAGCNGVMGAYNRINGYYSSYHPHIVDDILRDEWQYDGIMVSDWGSILDTVEAGNSGIDVDMRTTFDFENYPFAAPLKQAVLEGKVAEEKLDEKVCHVLTVMNRLHMLDGERQQGQLNALDTPARLQKAAEETIVLLKNENGLLPLDASKIKKILVVGDNADRMHAFGGGSAEIKALYEVTPLLGLRMFLGGNVQIEYERGYYCYVIGSAWRDTANSQGGSGGNYSDKLGEEEIQKLNREYLHRALEKAKEADVVLFIGGTNHDYDVEARDKADMKLPADQEEVVKALLKVRPDTIITLMTGGPLDMQDWSGDAKALLTYSYNGMRGGYALAEVLFGACNPSGKLPVTFPLCLEDSPAHKIGEFGTADKTDYAEGIFVGYRYYDTYRIKPAFAFGHGLSYSEFEFGKLSAQTEEDAAVSEAEQAEGQEGRSGMPGEREDPEYCGSPRNTHHGLKVTLKIEVTNKSDRAGACTVLFFTGALDGGIQRPEKELKEFQKQELAGGETKLYEAVLDASAFSYYDEEEKCFMVKAGRYAVCAAFAADDVRSVAEITIRREYHLHAKKRLV